MRSARQADLLSAGIRSGVSEAIPGFVPAAGLRLQGGSRDDAGPAHGAARGVPALLWARAGSAPRADRGYRLVLSPAAKTIAIRGFNYSSDGKVLNDKEYAFPGKNRVSVQIFVCDNNMEAFVDGQECLSARVVDRSCYKVAIEITGGRATIRKPFLRYFRNEEGQ